MFEHLARRIVLTAGIVAMLAAFQPFFAQQRRTAVPAKKRNVSAPETAEQKRRKETFLAVIATLAVNYFDPRYDNLYWIRLKNDYQSRVNAVRSDTELHDLLSEMIAKLNVSHLMIIPPEVTRAIESARIEAKAREAERKKSRNDEIVPPGPDDLEDDELSEYGIGAELRLIDGKFVIARFSPNSSAEKAGLKTGFVIERINGVVLSDILRRIANSTENAKPLLRTLAGQISTWFLNGDKDTAVNITYLDENDAAKELTIKREKLYTEWIKIANTLPERPLTFESRSLNEDVGYIHFNYFALPVVAKFCDAIGTMKGKKALVLDLRGNYGGVLATMSGLAGMLSPKNIALGTARYRTGDEIMSAESKAKHFDGKIVILTDDQSISAAEVFAAALRDNDLAVVVGTKTAGAALPSLSIELPTGAILQYPIADFRSPQGNLLEGAGLTPDVEVPLVRKDLLAGGDTQLNAALSLIQSDRYSAILEQHRKKRAALAASMGDRPPPPPPPRSISGPIKQQNVPVQSVRDNTAPPEPKEKKDSRAVKVIDDLLTAIGGREAVRSLNTYEVHGRTDLLMKGARNSFQLSIFRDGPNLYSEVLNSAVSGEIREVFNNGKHFVQTDYGMTKEMPPFVDVVENDIFSAFRSLAEDNYFSTLNYSGIFDREGRKVHVLDGITKDGMLVALAIDTETDLLASFTGSYYGLSFNDYNEVGRLKLPFSITRQGLMSIELDEVAVGKKADPKIFTAKTQCFDIAD